MTATLTNAAQQGTTTQAPRTRKPRKASAFVILRDDGDDSGNANGKIYALVSDASSVKDARAKGVDLPDGEYEIYCRRGKFTVSTPPAKKVVKASK